MSLRKDDMGGDGRAGDSELPVTNEDRERAIELLRGASDRLELEELEHRLEAAVQARTRGQLAVLTWDLNQLPAKPTPRRLRVWQNGGFQMHAAAYTLTNAFLVGTWELAGGGFFWPFFPAAGWGIGLSLHAIGTSAYLRHQHQRALNPKPRIRARLQPPRPLPPGQPRQPQPSGPWSAGAEQRRHTVAVLFSDVVESTPLTQAVGDEQWTRIRARHLALLRECYAQHQGEEVSAKGDGFLARFESPTHAARCAVEIQRRLQARRDGDDFALAVRVGLHSGEAVVESDDVLGTVVNLAARVMSEAEPSEVLVTETVADQLDVRFKFDDRGLRTLKGFSEPRHLLAIRWD